MNTKTKETIEKAIPLIDQAAQTIKNITDALGYVIVRAADVSSSGSTLDATLKTLPNVQNQILYAAAQINQAIKADDEPQNEEEATEQPAPEKKDGKKA